MKKKPLISIEDLTVKFKKHGKDFTAVNKANLKIFDKEIVGIVGESGSGKTTLGYSILGVWPHAAGSVYIDGKEVAQDGMRSSNKNNKWLYKSGQIIFQDPTASIQHQKKVIDVVLEGYRNLNIFDKVKKETIGKIEKKIIEEKRKILYVNDKEELIREIANELFEVEKRKILLEEKEKSPEAFLNKKIKELKSLTHDYKNNLKISIGEKKTKFIILDDEKSLFNKNLRSLHKIILSEKKINKLNNVELRELAYVENKYLFRVHKFLQKSGAVTKEEIFYDLVEFEFSKNPSPLLEIIYKNTNVESLWTSISLRKMSVTFLRRIMAYIHYCDDILNNVNEKLENAKKDADKERFKNIINVFTETKQFCINLIENFSKNILDFFNTPSGKIPHIFKKLYRVFINVKKVIVNENNKYYLDVLEQTFKSNVAERKGEIIKLEKKVSLEKSDNIGKVTLKKEERDEFVQLTGEIENVFSSVKSSGTLDNKFNKLKMDILKDAKSKLKTKEFKTTKDDLKLHEKKLNELEKKKKKMIEKYENSNKKEIEREEAIKYMELVGLYPEDLNRYPVEFSGGQKQRISIARTILTKSRFIIADEPVSALDVSIQAQIIKILQNLRKKLGIAIIFIAHDLEVVKYLVDRVVVMYRGNIVEHGDVEKVIENPYHPYTKSLLSAIPNLKEIGKGINFKKYDDTTHGYNEYTNISVVEVEKEHFVRGTLQEIKK